MKLQLQPVSEINVRFLLLCSSPTVGGFFIDSPYCQPLSIAPFIIHLGPQDFFSDFQNHQVVWLQMAFCTCLKSKKNVARFEVSQLQTWNLSFFSFFFFFLKSFSHFLNFAPCNEKQYLVQATVLSLGTQQQMCIYSWLFLYTRRGRTGVLRGEIQTPNQGTTRVECCFKQ